MEMAILNVAESIAQLEIPVLCSAERTLCMEIDTADLETGIPDMEISIPGLAERTPANEFSTPYLEMKTTDESETILCLGRTILNAAETIANYEF